MNKQKVASLVINLLNPKFSSGVVYAPPTHPEIVFIFTAQHCIKDASISEIKGRFGNTDFQNISHYDGRILQFEGDHEDENDIAILVLPSTLFPSEELASFQYEFLDNFFDIDKGVLVGYPNAHDNVKELKGTFRQDIPNTPFSFEVRTPSENLTTIFNDGLEAAKGMSGGGFFLEIDNRIYLAGILIKFFESYKDFRCVGVERFNQLLQANGYAPIAYSYATSIGLHHDWFGDHIDNSVDDLGDRYTPEINFELPIVKRFDGLTRGKVFKEWVEKHFHDFLKVLGDKARDLNQPEHLKLSESLLEQYNWYKTSYLTIDWSVSGELQLDSLKDKLEKTKQICSTAQRKILHLQYEQREEKREQGVEYYTPIHSSALGKLQEITKAARDFTTFLYSKTLALAEKSCLLLHGKAGYGKSHLLGDIAKQKQMEGKPAILILGNKLKNRDNVWLQIIQELGLQCSTDTLLHTLNAIGEHIGERVLFMIDALNEGEGKVFWKDCLTGFIQTFRKYPFIGLVLAVRDAYIDMVVPEHLWNSDKLVRIEHQGFNGNELEAIKHFCRYFGLREVRFPVLSPEFSNPQLLLLFCRSLKESGKSEFPKGLNGITQIYEVYLDSINRKLARRLEYSRGEKLVQDSLEHLARELAELGIENTKHSKARRIFENFDSTYGSKLFLALLKEGTLHEDRDYNYEKEAYEEVIRFNYEKFGDFIMARHLLEQHIDATKSIVSLQDGTFWDKHFGEKLPRRIGIIRALAVLIPEKYGFEILQTSLVEYVKEDHYFSNQIIAAFFDSLLWRKISSINKAQIQEYCMSWVEERGYEYNFYELILRFALIPEHPYNANHIHDVLIQKSMAEIDRDWSPFLHEIYENRQLAINRLISWIWSDFDLDNLEEEVRCLAATIIVWFLPSSNTKLRDTATLTLVRLLSGYPHTMVAVLQKFEPVNDLYISERLFAVALGVTTNSGTNRDIGELAQYVYNQVFKDGKPPVHILLRDYARMTIEYAIANDFELSIDANNLIPPYGSGMPLSFPTKEDIEKYKIDDKSEDSKAEYWHNKGQRAIATSVLVWDFNRYTINSATRNFYEVPLWYSNVYDEFKRTLPYGTKGKFKQLEDSFRFINRIHRKAELDEYAKLWQDRMLQLSDELINFIESKFSPEQQYTFKTKILPYIKLHNSKENGRRSSIQPQPIARWIFNRVFELGWDKEWHGDFDAYSADDGFDRLRNRVERIGKKYQWIAFHEILAMIADNHNITDHNGMETYEGTWQPFLRNIDPTYPTLNSDSEFFRASKEKIWWQQTDYDEWSIEEWQQQTDDLPDPRTLIEFKDPDGEEWLNLLTFPRWKNQYEFGVDKMASSRQEIWYHLRAYFIKKSTATKAHKWLLEQHFMGRWMPEESEESRLFEKEFYWSPAYKYREREREESNWEGNRIWRRFGESSYKGIVPVEEYQAGGGSWKNQGYSTLKPSAFLWEKMGLKQGQNTSEYVDDTGKVICFDPSVVNDNTSGLMIRKKELLQFLEKEGLALCWTLLGEKGIHNGGLGGRYTCSELSGAYLLNADGRIEGGVEIKKNSHSL